ncbi:SEL1-like repeat protein [Priestia megaterium]
MMELGYRLLVGEDLDKNQAEGEKWLQKAAEAGETIAMREWGKYLIHGVIK